MIEKVKSTLYLIIDGVLLVIIMLLAVIIADIASNIGTPEILEIKHDGSAAWYTEDSIKLKDEDYVPADAVYIKTLKNFIRGMRMVESFYDNNEKNVKTTLLTSIGTASKMVEKRLEENNPFKLSETKTVDVPYNSITITKITQSQWKASWRERTYDRNGVLIEENDYEAVLHTKIKPTKDLGGELNPKVYNPLGIYIYDYDIDLLRKLI